MLNMVSEIAEFQTLVDSNREKLPNSIYLSLDHDIEMAFSTHEYRDKRFLDYIKLYTVLIEATTDKPEFWSTAEEAAKKSEICGWVKDHYGDLYPEWFQKKENPSVLLEQLWGIFLGVNVQRNLRPWGKVRNDIDNARGAAQKLDQAFTAMFNNYLPDDKSNLEIDFGMISEDDFDVSTIPIEDFAELLKELKQRLDRASPSIRKRKAPHRHTYFATQVSNWFKETEGKPRKNESIVVTASILKRIDPTVETFDSCL